MRRHLFAYCGAAAVALLLAQSPAAAQDDPPSRVARLSYIRGNVSFEPAGTDDWIEATMNRPLTTGDGLWTDSGSRAALHIASASINLSENTGFTFLNLADNSVQIQLSGGSLRVRVKWLDESENFEVDTPNLAFAILRPGIYKITVNPSGDTTVIEDRRGEGEVTGEGAAYSIHAGDIGTFYGTNQLNADVQNLDNRSGDDFERWCEQRDHHEDVSVSAHYVSDYAIGYDDLDDNGGWRQTEYGMVWFPYVNTNGWAPYHYGHWAYVSPWGYTWVDDAPWGFAPFHYGRWINEGGAWGWVPCPPRPANFATPYVRPVYAPALVAWIGGPHFGIGVALGSSVGSGVGWFPLGPREVYVPSYPVSRHYMNNVNVSNTVVNTTVVNNYYTNVVVNKTVNVNNVTYVNQRVVGAVAVTTPQAFSSGQPVARNVVRMDPRQIAAAPVNSMTPAAVPQRAAVLGGRAAVSVRPPQALQARAVVVRTAPPAPPPTFAKRQAAIQSNGGRPLSIVEARQIAPLRAQTAAAPQIRLAPPVRPVDPRAMQATRSAPPQQNQTNPSLRPVSPMPASPNPAPRAPAVANTVNGGMRPVTPPPPPVTPPPPPVRPQPPPGRPQPPPSAYPSDERLEKQHQQQLMNLHQQQDQERQKMEQQQQQQQATQLQRQADAAKLQQAQDQRQQQLHALEQRQQQQQQQLEQKQESQHRAQQMQQPQVQTKEKPQPKERDKEKPKDVKPPPQ